MQTGHQIELGEWLRDQGLTHILEHTPDSWVEAFEENAGRLLRTQGSFTAEEVVAHIGPPPNHVNAIGAVCRAYARRNDLVGSYEKATNSAAHARVIDRWRDAHQP
jgi:hypothetical protein